SAAATRLIASPITMTEPSASTTPKPSASPGARRPVGIGRPLVRDITASMSRSYHMFMAPETPAPMGMHRMAVLASTGRSRPGAQIILADELAGREGAEDDEDEQQRRGEGEVGAERGHHVPAGIGVGIVRNTARHAGEPEEVLREEGEVDADEGGPEMDLAER